MDYKKTAKIQAKSAINEEKSIVNLLLRQETILDTLKNENLKYKESNFQLNNQIIENKSKIQSINHQNFRLIEGNKKLREHLSTSQKHGAFFMHQIKAVKNKEKDIKTALNETQEKLKELSKSEKSTDKFELINKISQLKSVLQIRSQNQKQEILEKNIERNYESVTISESIAIKQEVIITLNNQNMQLIEEKNQLENKLGITRIKIEELNRENLKLIDEKSSLKDQINASQKYNARLLDKLNQKFII